MTETNMGLVGAGRLTTDTNITFCKLRAQVIAGSTGKAYIGKYGVLNTATLAGVAKEFWPNPSGGVSDEYTIEVPASGLPTIADVNPLRLSDYAVDFGVTGEHLLITYWSR